jgi:hypothetical protein
LTGTLPGHKKARLLSGAGTIGVSLIVSSATSHLEEAEISHLRRGPYQLAAILHAYEMLHFSHVISHVKQLNTFYLFLVH